MFAGVSLQNWRAQAESCHYIGLNQSKVRPLPSLSWLSYERSVKLDT